MRDSYHDEGADANCLWRVSYIKPFHWRWSVHQTNNTIGQGRTGVCLTKRMAYAAANHCRNIVSRKGSFAGAIFGKQWFTLKASIDRSPNYYTDWV